MRYEIEWFSEKPVAPKELSEGRYRDIKASRETCLLALGFEEKFALLTENYFELERELLQLTERIRIWPNRDLSQSMQERLLLDRRFVNLLTSCRLYIDQVAGVISDLFGNPSKELADYRKFTSDLYDNVWGYRLLEAVRNHVQHAELPVRVIRYQYDRAETDRSVQFQVSVIPELSIDLLAEDKKFKPKILEELRERKTSDLRAPIREYLNSLFQIHSHVRALLNGRVLEARERYATAVAEAVNVDGGKPCWPQLVRRNDDGTTAEQVPLDAEFLDYYNVLLNANRVTNRLIERFTANRFG